MCLQAWAQTDQPNAVQRQVVRSLQRAPPPGTLEGNSAKGNTVDPIGWESARYEVEPGARRVALDSSCHGAASARFRQPD